MATVPEIHSDMKRNILQRHGWPGTYDPCGFDPCRIRFSLSFTRDNDTELQNLLEDFSFARQKLKETL
jgi:hypothetical protein